MLIPALYVTRLNLLSRKYFTTNKVTKSNKLLGIGKVDASKYYLTEKNAFNNKTVLTNFLA